MKSILNITLATLVCVASIISCKKKDNPALTTPTVDTGRVYMEYFTEVGGSKLNLNNQWYKNQNGDSFTVSKFNYYISNVVMKGSGSTPDYSEPNSYHLIEHSATPSDMTFYIDKVPGGDYKAVTFMIGVDSLRNVSGAQGGALDPIKGNFWDWNTGYIMLKFEGTSPKATTTGKKIMLHSGGFSGVNNVLKTVTLDMPSEIKVTKGQANHIHFTADIQKMFKSPNVIDFSVTQTIMMPGVQAKKLSDNYANMFTITYAGL